jgi:hypothetical protein
MHRALGPDLGAGVWSPEPEDAGDGAREGRGEQERADGARLRRRVRRGVNRLFLTNFTTFLILE